MIVRIDCFSVRCPLAGTAIAGGYLLGEALVAALLVGDVPVAGVAALHMVLSLAATMLIARARRDFAAALMIGMAMLTLGPLGLVAALLGERWAVRAAAAANLSDWHERIAGGAEFDPAARLYNDILEQRAYRPGPVPVPWATIMTSGTVESRQRVLGLLAKRDGIAHQGLLEAGLLAPELAVRASAAAVAASLDERKREERR